MAYVKRKRIKGREYYYLAESYRADGKVKTRTLAYLGTTPQVPKELTHLLGKSRRRRQKSFWDTEALGRAIARQLMSQVDEKKQLG